MSETLSFHCVGVLSHRCHTRRTCQVQQDRILQPTMVDEKLNERGFGSVMNTGAIGYLKKVCRLNYWNFFRLKKYEATDVQLYGQSPSFLKMRNVL